jgi:hypothetical protein
MVVLEIKGRERLVTGIAVTRPYKQSIFFFQGGEQSDEAK